MTPSVSGTEKLCYRGKEGVCTAQKFKFWEHYIFSQFFVSAPRTFGDYYSFPSLQLNPVLSFTILCYSTYPILSSILSQKGLHGHFPTIVSMIFLSLNVIRCYYSSNNHVWLFMDFLYLSIIRSGLANFLARSQCG